MASLAVCTHHDDLLGLVAPFAIASFRPTVLVVDLEPDGLGFPGERTLAALVEDSPTLAELVPERAGVASLPNGGISADETGEVLSALQRGWPSVVFRSRHPIDGMPFVNVRPELGSVGAPGQSVWVKSGFGVDEESEGPRVRPPGRAAFLAARSGRTMRGRWLRSWEQVWEWPWP
jgi:hypothetical protein